MRRFYWVDEVGWEAVVFACTSRLCARTFFYMLFAGTVQSVMTTVCLALVTTAEPSRTNRPVGLWERTRQEGE
jgi:hypothetical protein